MKFVYPIIFLILCVSCKSESDITEFEKILGKDNSETLSFLVEDFESDFLKRQYPDLNTKKAYEQFLKDLSNEDTDDWLKISNQTRDVFDNSSLKLAIYSVPDSIWIEREREKPILPISQDIPILIVKRKYLLPDGTFEYSFSRSPLLHKEPMNEDSIIESRKNWISINSVGNYSRALRSIQNKSAFLSEFLELREAAGVLDPRLIAYNMLESKVDLDDYFIKRLIITEIVY